MTSTSHPADPPHNRQLPATVAEATADIRQQALVHFRRVLYELGMLALAGVVAAATVWLLAAPINRDANMASAAMAVGLAIFFVGGMLGRIVLPRPEAKCPQCGCDWYVESDNDMHKWVRWQNCPGCGLELHPHDGEPSQAHRS